VISLLKNVKVEDPNKEGVAQRAATPSILSISPSKLDLITLTIFKQNKITRLIFYLNKRDA